ncbi:hypothetical protein BDV95DRAFT_481922 [Massariosphaeria phaeospora]|uniref:Zn(2)-C6 fungal-type domain-containing protein n=1 Tax=Massariosphaeria phaeospora TaxID=100035 RepID=A0A7C8MD74_9PLEO|nr:hypothetical protein BDV95DRAFT_481922 [Massariosphaeria phaeospora]
MNSDREGQRKRAKHTRSKQGCRVCRIRRIRCDLVRPACLKCSSTGRKCEGYPTAPGDSCSALRLVPRSPFASSASSQQERRSLHYFQCQTAPQFTGHFDSDFWSSLVLQVGSREPCVQSAVVALGSLHEAFENCSTPGRPITTHQPSVHAYDYYSRAISLLNTHIRTEGWQGLDVSLICCILCVGFEWLRGCYAAADTHLRSGLLILRQWFENRGSGPCSISFFSPAGHLIRSQLTPMFTRLTLQARSFIATQYPWTPAMLEEKPIVDSKGLKAALESLEAILCQMYLQAEAYEEMNEQRLATFSNRLAHWSKLYAHHLSTVEPTPHTIVLVLLYETATIMLGTSHSYSQMQFDAYTPNFLRIVEMAELLSSSTTSRFSMDIETVPLLYYVGIKCRHSIIRRKAIALLASGARREGAWDGSATARLAEEIVHIEEGGVLDENEQHAVSATARVCNLRVHYNLEHRNVAFRFMRQHESVWSPERTVSW